MALIKWGALVTDGRGKIGGQVLTKGRSGAVIRNKVTPTNPQSSRQVAARQRLTQLSQGWRDLTQAQRDLWDGMVDAYSKTNVFGDIVKPTGKNLYTALGVNRLLIGESPLDAPLTPSEIIPSNLMIDSLEVPTNLVFDVIQAASGQKIVVQASAPVSPGISYPPTKLRIIGVIDQATAGTVDLSSNYVSAWGDLVAGSKVFFKYTTVVVGSGQASVPNILSGVPSS